MWRSQVSVPVLGTGGRVFESHHPENKCLTQTKKLRHVDTINSMNLELILFYLFSSVAIVSGLMVIRAENPVHSVLFLILTFFNASGLLLLLEVEFLAMIFIIVYVGAIAILFLFVVMMLNIKITKDSNELLKYLPIGGLVGIIFLMEIFLITEKDYVPLLDGNIDGIGITEWDKTINTMTNAEVLGQLMYTYYFYFFIVAGFILLVAMIGAIILTMQAQSNVRRQQVFQQVSRNLESAIFLVDNKKI
jgi:NADH-quinone oxidoreductase subunit J|tara:strand:+ start:3736 stop:4479 length:744 start_codon:yes stop_codon:yes gene_type:complete